ncbi:MAG: hypothetical protein ACOVLB_05110 [Candidatus Nanopelagicus sp.]
MAQTTTLILLPQTPQTSGVPVTGGRVPAASYYLGNSNLQTLTWILAEVTADISFEATLAESPTADDWFEVHSFGTATLTSTNYYNLSGNFVWLRVVVTNFTYGIIQSIKVSY